MGPLRASKGSGRAERRSRHTRDDPRLEQGLARARPSPHRGRHTVGTTGESTADAEPRPYPMTRCRQCPPCSSCRAPASAGGGSTTRAAPPPSPLYSGERARGEGLWRSMSSVGSRMFDVHVQERRTSNIKGPLTLTLSPEYRGEGTRAAERFGSVAALPETRILRR